MGCIFPSSSSIVMDQSSLVDLIGDRSLMSAQLPLSILNVIVSFAHGFNHVFSSSQCHPHISISQQATVVRKQTQDGWSRRVRCGHIMLSGKHFIEMKVLSRSRDLSIGICVANCPAIDRFVGFDTRSYSLCCTGKLQHNSDADWSDPYAAHWSCTPFANDDVIGMLLDLDNLSLIYFKNGQELGEAFNIEKVSDKNGGYTFAVSMAVTGDGVEIME